MYWNKLCKVYNIKIALFPNTFIDYLQLMNLLHHFRILGPLYHPALMLTNLFDPHVERLISSVSSFAWNPSILSRPALHSTINSLTQRLEVI